jgi:hypothetical protein
MERATELVSALKLDTEFLDGGVKHRRHVPKPIPSQPIKKVKKRKRPHNALPHIGRDSSSPVDIESTVQIDMSSPHNIDALSSPQIEDSTGTADGGPSIRVKEAPVPEEPVFIEIEEVWDIEPSSIIGKGSFGIVRFERRRPQMADHTQTTHNQVRAVKEVRKLSTPDYMKELQAIARFSRAPVRWNLNRPLNGQRLLTVP